MQIWHTCIFNKAAEMAVMCYRQHICLSGIHNVYCVGLKGYIVFSLGPPWEYTNLAHLHIHHGCDIIQTAYFPVCNPQFLLLLC